MNNQFEVGAKYNAAQNISRLSLANGHTPLFFQGLEYMGFDSKEHIFRFEGELKWFDDELINTGRAEDNSMVFSKPI